MMGREQGEGKGKEGRGGQNHQQYTDIDSLVVQFIVGTAMGHCVCVCVCTAHIEIGGERVR